ncbi:Cro/CI family transcriptional regulator [Escherichia coli]|nr:Cro/CI family transcriptional regulator [Escherichia coli]
MITQDAIDYFGSKARLAKAAGVSQPAVSRWGKLVPEKRAARLSLMTDGQLIYDPGEYQDSSESVNEA